MLTDTNIKLGPGIIAVGIWVALVVFKVPDAEQLITGCQLYLAGIGAYHLKTSQGDDKPAKTQTGAP